MGNRLQKQENWEANERGSDYRLKYRSWRQGEAEGGPVSFFCTSDDGLNTRSKPFQTNDSHKFNTPTALPSERQRATSTAIRATDITPSYAAKSAFLDSVELEGWIPNIPVVRSQSANLPAASPRSSVPTTFPPPKPHASDADAGTTAVTVFPPEAAPSATKARGTIHGYSVNEILLEELAKAVSNELIGPEYTPLAKTTSPVVSPPVPPSNVGGNTKPVGPDSKNGGAVQSMEEAKEEEPRVQMVINHLYHPVLTKVKEHLRSLPEWYTVKTPPQEVARHIRVLLEARREGVNKVAVSATPLLDQALRLVPGYFVVVVCAKDRRQLLDAITRCVSLRASISEATILTTGDGYALDRFVLSLRPDDTDRSLFDDLDVFAHALKTDIEEVLAVTPESPALGPYVPNGQQSGRPSSSAHKRASSNASSVSTESSKLVVASSSLANGTGYPHQNSGMAARFEVPFQEVRLVRVLGEGRTGKTYLADWQGTKVAAKVMSIEGDDHGNNKAKGNMDEFRRELHLVSKLSHPNIVRFVGASARPPRYILLFELCEGGDLASLIRQKDVKYSFFQIALDIANGLAYLHRNDVIHRDVKPENIMLDKDQRAKVADFGLSCYASGAAAEFTAETGTYRYMAPEVMRHERYSFPADVYSFALVCYTLLSRKPPFEDSTPLQAAMAVARQDARPKLSANLPKQLVDLVTRCWAKNPTNRPDFEEVMTELGMIRAEHLNNRSRKLLDWGFHEKKRKSSKASPFSPVTSLATTAL